MKEIMLKKKKDQAQLLLAGFGFLSAAYYFFNSYFPLSWTHLLALFVLPFLLDKRESNKQNRVGLILAIICFMVAAWLGLKSLLFLGFILALIHLLKYAGYTGGTLFFIGVVLFSPIWYWFDLNISFNLRLMLTEWAGAFLGNSGYTIHGNLIKGPRGEFTVEKACAGLNMLKYALLAGLLMLSLGAKQANKSVRNSAPFTFLGIIFLLSLLSNLARILFLVIIPQGPESLGHHMIGLLYLLGLVIAPSFLLIYKFSHLFLTDKKVSVELKNKPKSQSIFVGLLLLCFVASGLLAINHTYKPATDQSFLDRWNGFKHEGMVNGVHKFTRPGYLVWVKPLEGFYSAEHSPLACWRGSGYNFNESGLNEVNGNSYPHGTLQSENNTLYTAWWFESEKSMTGDIFAWRKEALLKGESFYLVNVTTDSPEKLDEMVEILWKKNEGIALK
jgi:exosortase N